MERQKKMRYSNPKWKTSEHTKGESEEGSSTFRGHSSYRVRQVLAVDLSRDYLGFGYKQAYGWKVINPLAVLQVNFHI